MAPPGSGPPARLRPRLTAAFAPAVLGLVVLMQWVGGAYQAEFGGYPDEPAHYVTALMIRDYVAGGFPGPPLTFAQDYYNHYPKVALGNWPPLFYVIQSAWTLVFTPERVSVLLLMALLTAAVALMITWTLARQFGTWEGVLGGIIFIAFPVVQQHAAMIMTEIPVALLSLAATLCFGRYLESGRTRDSVWFGIFASAAILTKGSGLVLALVPVLGIVFSGRYELLRQRNFWYPVVIVAVVAGPWTWAFREVARAGWQEDEVSWAYTRTALMTFPGLLLTGQSLILTVLAATGLATVLAGLYRRVVPLRWAAVAALLVVVPLFHAIVPASLDERHLMQALPAWAMLIVWGVVTIRRHLAPHSTAMRLAVVAIVLLGLVQTAWPIEIKQGRGFGAVVDEIVQDPAHADAIFLVSSDATGEGMFIAETAMRLPGAERVIRRASKLLASQQWHGGDYQLKADNPESLIDLLRQQHVRFVVIDRSVPHTLLSPHHELLRSTAASTPDTFTLRRTYPTVRGYPYRGRTVLHPDGIAVYEIEGAAAATAAAHRQAAQ